VLLLGARGQVGRELQRRIPRGTQLVARDKDELDISDQGAVFETVREQSPELIINAAAYTAVDEAESDRDAAFAVNSTGARNLALAARDTTCRLVHISSDFIFDGKQGRPYRPGDEAHPLSAYGRSKLDGEEAVTSICGSSAVTVRSSWIYSEFGGNFVKTMLSLLQHRTKLGVVSDQIGCPHWTDAGVASWFDFAVAIQEIALELGLLESKIPIEPISSEAYPTPAVRPSYSVLDTSEIRDRLTTVQPHWRDALHQMLERMTKEDHA
jgi:dTDP-4-dehydrorhamnose reductase